jgi:multimeric flavodoxin WrbA
MKALGFNGSPRKNKNTATLVNKALEGAASEGAKTEIVHLYDIDYKGCSSCLSCKLKGGASYGRCAVRDGLTPFLDEIRNADALILGSPNYIGSPSAAFKAFLERLTYPYVAYSTTMPSLFPKCLPTGFIYTMSSNDFWMKEAGYDHPVRFIERALGMIFGASESLLSNDTSLFDDYSKYEATTFDPAAKARVFETQFPIDCRKSFEMGVRLVRQAAARGRQKESEKKK